MNKFYAAVVLILALLAYDYWRSTSSYNAGWDAASVEILESTALAVETARKAEQEKQEKVNAALQKRFDDANIINGRLNASLDRLRNRPKRVSLSETALANCKGVTGKELSSEDGRFLTRESARADRIRSALETCYTYADAVEAQYGE